MEGTAADIILGRLPPAAARAQHHLDTMASDRLRSYIGYTTRHPSGGEHTTTKVLTLDGKIHSLSEEELAIAVNTDIPYRLTADQPSLSKMAIEWLIEYKLRRAWKPRNIAPHLWAEYRSAHNPRYFPPTCWPLHPEQILQAGGVCRNCVGMDS